MKSLRAILPFLIRHAATLILLALVTPSTARAQIQARNCIDLFRDDTFADSEQKSLDGSTNPTLAKRISMILKLAKRKNFDHDPFVVFISEAIQQDGKIIYNGAMSFDGRADVKNGILQITVSSLNAKRGLLDKMGITSPGRAQGLNTVFAKTLYAILRGASKRLKSDDSIRLVRMNASSVINTSLKQTLTDFGFKKKLTGAPLMAAEISNDAQNLYLEINSLILNP